MVNRLVHAFLAMIKSQNVKNSQKNFITNHESKLELSYGWKSKISPIGFLACRGDVQA